MKKERLILVISILFVMAFAFCLTGSSALAAEPNADGILDIEGDNYEIVADYYNDDGERSFIVRVPTDADAVNVNISAEYLGIENISGTAYSPVPAGEYFHFVFSENRNVHPGDYSYFFGNSGFDLYSSYEYKLIYFFFDDYPYLDVYFFQSDIPIYGEPDSADKTALNAAIARIWDAEANEGTGGYLDGYYTENDRYNGTNTSKTGFWAELTAANGPLDTALKVSQSNNYSQEKVDEVTANLEEAIGKLIPKDRVNPTVLYEMIYHDQINYAYHRGGDYYTKLSWQNFVAARSDAVELLASMYIQSGEDEGQPSAANSAAKQEELDGAAEALWDAYEGLTPQKSLEEAQEASKSVTKYKKILLEMIENRDMKAEDYTEESWADFQEKLAAARSSEAPPLTGLAAEYTALREYINSFEDLYHAFYWGLVPKGDISVKLVCSDSFAARRFNERDGLTGIIVSQAGYNGTVTLSEGYTLADALIEAGIVNNTDRLFPSVYLNGVFVSREYIHQSLYLGHNPALYSASMKNIILHDGDEVRVNFRVEPMTMYSPTIATGFAKFFQYESSLRYTRFAEGDGIEVEAGESFTLTAESAFGGMTTEAKDFSPAANLTFFISDAAEEGTLNQPTVNRLQSAGEDIITDADGKAKLRLFREGWYVIGAFDLAEDILGDQPNEGPMTSGTYPSVNSGAVIRVHVLPSENTEEIKAELEAELTAFFEEQVRSRFNSDDWSALNIAYQTALWNLRKATAVGDAYDAQQTGIIAIKEIRDRVDAENISKPKEFRAMLKRLPADLSLLDQSVGHIVEEGLIPLYESMSAHQRGLLTGAEIARYDAAKALCADTLPEAVEYDLSFRFVGDSDESTAALNDMLNYLQSQQSYEDAVGGGAGGGKALREIGQFRVIDRAANNSWNDVVSENAASSNADDIVDIAVNFDYDAYFLVRDDEDHLLSGEGWEISDENFGFSDYYTDSRGYTYYDVISGFSVKLNGVEYEVKKVRCDGVAEKDILKRDSSVLDYSSYRGKDPNNVNVNFLNTLYRFNMPYRDVAVEVVWGPVSGDTAEYAVDELTRVLSGYKRADYTAADWKKLTEAYYEGVNAIYEAGGKEAIIAAKNEALAAMAAVPVRAEDDYGSVFVSFYNTTYEEGLGYDESEPFISETIALEADDSMMTAALKALAKNDYTWSGTGGIGMGIGYLSGIAKDGESLREFDGGGSSGWMGTLNDWFVNRGFNGFTVNSANENTRLRDGDVIKIMYTVTGYGFDLGASWQNNDTSLKALSLSGAALQPEFAADSYEYIATLDHNPLTAFAVNAEAANKNFQTRIYVNSRAGSSWYAAGEEIPIKAGDVIHIGVGEGSWPTMNSGNISGTWYTVYVLGEGSSMTRQAEALIENLPDVDEAELEDEEAIRFAETFCGYLSEEEMANVGNREKLEALLEKIGALNEVEAVSSLIAKLPAADAVQIEDEEDIIAAEDAYAKLKQWQKDAMQQRYGRKLVAVREALDLLKDATADERAAAAVINQINALPEDLTLDDAEAVAAAREAFEGLTAAQKDLVPFRVLNKLVIAEITCNKLQNKVPTPFIDIEGHWSEDDVGYVYHRGLMKGMSEDRFAPDGEISRGMVVTVLYRIDGKPAVDGETAFTDVQEGQYYRDAVIWAAENDIVNGVSETAFAPNRSISREQLAAMIYRYARYKGIDISDLGDLSAYNDADQVSEWAKEAMGWANKAGLIRGRSKTELAPSGTTTRAEFAAIITRYLKNIVE